MISAMTMMMNGAKLLKGESIESKREYVNEEFKRVNALEASQRLLLLLGTKKSDC